MSDQTWWLDYGELDDDQRAIVDLDADGSYLLLGPPGSGKTNLLLLRAAYLSRSQRPNVQVLVFNRSLREFVSRGVSHYQLHAGQVQTIARWGYDFLREHGVNADAFPKALIESRRAVAAAMRDVIDARPALEGSIECLFVDEIQDCLQLEIDNFFRLGKDVCFAGDRRQRVYDVEDVMDGLVARFGPDHTKVLRHHYRNGVRICKVADAIGKTSGEPPIAPSCNYNESRNPSEVEFRQFDSQDAQRDALEESLHRQLKAYPEELLGVACPRRDDVESLRAHLQNTSLSPHMLGDRDLAADGDRRVYLTTLTDMKGLEFRTVHLLSMDTQSRLGAAQKRIAYTATTRAKTLLTVFSVGSVAPYLQQGREAVTSPAGPPDPTTLFPRKAGA